VSRWQWEAARVVNWDAVVVLPAVESLAALEALEAVVEIE
jgi:hypothetical protein